MKTAATIAASVALTATAAFAGGEPSPPYYRAPAPYYAPPVIVTAPWPNPIDGLVEGVLVIPGVVLGGLFGAIAPPAVVSCVGPDGSLFPCPMQAPGYPAYPSPYGAVEPPPPANTEPGYYAPPDPPRPSSGARRPCYGPDGGFIGGPGCRG
jgi:hypothetical protein